jgi:hypothetical protein
MSKDNINMNLLDRFFRAYYCRANKVDCKENDLPTTTESGWIEKKDNKFYVANIPFFAEAINIDDEVDLKFENDSLPIVSKIVSRQYISKSVIEYSSMDIYENLKKVTNQWSGKIEGIQAPNFDINKKKFVRGKVIVASNISKQVINDVITSVGATLVWHNTFNKS